MIDSTLQIFIPVIRYESTIVIGTKNFVRENPGTIQRFANAVVRVMIWLNKNSNEAAAEKALPMFQAGNMGADAIGYLRPSLSIDGLKTPEGHKTIVSFCRAEGIIDRDIPYDEVNDMSFVKKASEKLPIALNVWLNISGSTLLPPTPSAAYTTPLPAATLRSMSCLQAVRRKAKLIMCGDWETCRLSVSAMAATID